MKKRYKILLLRPYQYINKAYWPYTPYPPLGIEYLAKEIKKDHDVIVHDSIFEYQYQKFAVQGRSNLYHIGASDDQTIQIIKEKKPDIVGISALFITLEPCIKSIALAIKRYNPKIKLIIGGPCASSNQDIIKDDNIDMLVIGEGEVTFKELLSQNFEKLETIKGLVYKRNGKIIKNSERELSDIEQFGYPKIEEIPLDYFECWKNFLSLWVDSKAGINIPDFPGKKIFLNYLFNKLYKYEKRPNTTIITSRGCPYNCSFCAVKSVWKNKFRVRSSKSVLEEIDYWVNNHNIKHFTIVDDNFTIFKDRIIEIANTIAKNKYNITFSADSGLHVNHLDKDVLHCLKKMGFRKISLGIESGSQEVLDRIIRKNIKINKVSEVISNSKSEGLFTEGFFILGFPGETYEQMNESIEFMKKSGLDSVRLYTAQPIPGSDLYEKAVNDGLLSENYDPVNTLATDSINHFIKDEIEQFKFYQFINNARKELRSLGIFHDRIPLPYKYMINQ